MRSQKPEESHLLRTSCVPAESVRPRCIDTARNGLKPLIGLGEPSIEIAIHCARPDLCPTQGCFWIRFRPGQSAAPRPRKPDQGGLFA